MPTVSHDCKFRVMTYSFRFKKTMIVNCPPRGSLLLKMWSNPGDLSRQCDLKAVYTAQDIV